MTIQTVKKGDLVFVVRSDRWANRTKPAQCDWRTVVSAGPKYLTIDDPQRTQFHRDSGLEKSTYSPTAKVYTSDAEYFAAVARLELENQFKKLSQNVRPGTLTDAQLHQLVAILTQAAA